MSRWWDDECWRVRPEVLLCAFLTLWKTLEGILEGWSAAENDSVLCLAAYEDLFIIFTLTKTSVVTWLCLFNQCINAICFTVRLREQRRHKASTLDIIVLCLVWKSLCSDRNICLVFHLSHAAQTAYKDETEGRPSTRRFLPPPSTQTYKDDRPPPLKRGRDRRQKIQGNWHMTKQFTAELPGGQRKAHKTLTLSDSLAQTGPRWDCHLPLTRPLVWNRKVKQKRRGGSEQKKKIQFGEQTVAVYLDPHTDIFLLPVSVGAIISCRGVPFPPPSLWVSNLFIQTVTSEICCWDSSLTLNLL